MRDRETQTDRQTDINSDAHTERLREREREREREKATLHGDTGVMLVHDKRCCCFPYSCTIFLPRYL